MPAKNGKDGAKLKRQYSVFVGKMTGPKTKAGIAKVMSIGMTYAKEHAPVEYSTLINSVFRRIEETATGPMGIAGFANGSTKDGFNYAYYLHENKNWSPRRPSEKAGPSWNPNATPNYLADGFTLPSQKTMIMKALKGAYKK